jgi:hypothetical protein
MIKMKPLIEFLLACVLILVAGCSAIAGFFSASVWAAVFAMLSVAGLIFVLTGGTKNKQ